MKLYDSFQIKDLTLKNRIVMPPMCMYQALNHDGVATEFHTVHYAARALAGIGLIIVEATGVSPEGRISDACLGIYNENQTAALKKIVQSVHKYDAKIAIQLNHAGRKSVAVDGVDTIVAPSAIAYNETSRTPVELSTEEVKGIINQFKTAAQNADTAGFDALEIHAAHGYLINQFISPITNKRTDIYKNPTIFIEELMKSVTSVWPKHKPIIIRVSATDYEAHGYTVDDLIRILKPVSHYFDSIHVSSGGVTPSAPQSFPGYQVSFATQIRTALNTPVIAVGMITTREQIHDILENDRADLVAIGRPLLRNPHFFLECAVKDNQRDIIPTPYKRGY